MQRQKDGHQAAAQDVKALSLSLLSQPRQEAPAFAARHTRMLGLRVNSSMLCAGQRRDAAFSAIDIITACIPHSRRRYSPTPTGVARAGCTALYHYRLSGVGFSSRRSQPSIDTSTLGRHDGYYATLNTRRGAPPPLAARCSRSPIFAGRAHHTRRPSLAYRAAQGSISPSFSIIYLEESFSMTCQHRSLTRHRHFRQLMQKRRC